MNPDTNNFFKKNNLLGSVCQLVQTGVVRNTFLIKRIPQCIEYIDIPKLEGIVLVLVLPYEPIINHCFFGFKEYTVDLRILFFFLNKKRVVIFKWKKKKKLRHVPVRYYIDCTYVWVKT